jgi:predicted phosphodiesterase
MKADFIVTSDIHARETNPVSRIDNYWEALKKKILWLGNVQQQHGGIPIIDCGDLFDSWKSTPTVESWLIENLPQPFYTVIGNHEMPYHNINRFEKSSLNVLVKAGKVKILNWGMEKILKSFCIYGLNYKESSENYCFDKNDSRKKILVIHEMVTQEKTELFESRTPEQLKKQFPDFDLMVSGHNHKSFIEFENKFLSPGSFTRTSIDQINHQPKIYFVGITNSEVTIKAVSVPIEKDVFDIEQIEIRKQKDERIQNFVQSLSSDYSIDISFEKNLEVFCEKNKIRNGIREEIQLAMEDN